MVGVNSKSLQARNTRGKCPVSSQDGTGFENGGTFRANFLRISPSPGVPLIEKDQTEIFAIRFLFFSFKTFFFFAIITRVLVIH